MNRLLRLLLLGPWVLAMAIIPWLFDDYAEVNRLFRFLWYGLDKRY